MIYAFSLMASRRVDSTRPKTSEEPWIYVYAPPIISSRLIWTILTITIGSDHFPIVILTPDHHVHCSNFQGITRPRLKCWTLATTDCSKYSWTKKHYNFLYLMLKIFSQFMWVLEIALLSSAEISFCAKNTHRLFSTSSSRNQRSPLSSDFDAPFSLEELDAVLNGLKDSAPGIVGIP